MRGKRDARSSIRKGECRFDLLRECLAGACMVFAFMWLALEAFAPPGDGDIAGKASRFAVDDISRLDIDHSAVGGRGDANKASGPSPAAEGGNAALKPGDILLGRCRLSPVPALNPFDSWTHAALYAGGGRIIVAGNPATGVMESSLDSWRFPEMTWVTYVRVNSADEETRKRAVAFAREKLGQPYDINWLGKQQEGNSWYCSELVWAAYYNASDGGINLVGRPDWLGVSPDEIFMHDDTVEVGGHYEKRPDTIFSLAAKVSLMCILLSAAALKPFWRV